jgi:electron transport complex protein RnfD
MTTWSPAFTVDRFTALGASTWTLPFTRPLYDGVTSATPLALWKFERQASEVGELALGFSAGSTGETSTVLILVGGAYLVARNMMSWRIPVAIFAAVAALSGALHGLDPGAYPPPSFMLFSGGLMLGAVFMATDMVGSPMTSAGCLLYGAGIGVVVVVIRVWGGMPEGVMYAILLANACTCHVDRWFRPRVYGARAPEGAR